MVFVIVYALFIFVDLAVATASDVRPSQHQRLVYGVRVPGCHSLRLGLYAAHRVLCSSAPALWLLPHLPC